MATRFEIALHGGNPISLRAAGEEALDEVDRLENLLSLYRPGTEIARLNAQAHLSPVRVSPEVFRLLERARELSAETKGAFDPTIAPLVRAWGFMGGTGAAADETTIAAAKEAVGFHLVELNSDEFTVRFKREGVMLDLGAIGKGYAIERATELLRECGVTSALIHGGTSSSAAIGRAPDGLPWKVAITAPFNQSDQPFAVVELEDASLSVSAVWGRSFKLGEETLGHIIDPRTGKPARNAFMTAVVLPSPTEGDALTTALLTEPTLAGALHSRRPQMKSVVLSGNPCAPAIAARGITTLEKL
jgi:FAD:protein FMN transferase